MPERLSFAQVLDFWFDEAGAARWWLKDEAFDREIAERFGDLHAQALRCELYAWRCEPAGRLAEIIVLDQFSRNIFRNRAASFAADPLALALAQEAIAAGAQEALPGKRRSFLLLPFMHSESLAIHEAADPLFERNGDAQLIEFERKHRTIIERFGRYPHRNAVLGRESTAAELEFLREPGSSF